MSRKKNRKGQVRNLLLVQGMVQAELSYPNGPPHRNIRPKHIQNPTRHVGCHIVQFQKHAFHIMWHLFITPVHWCQRRTDFSFERSCEDTNRKHAIVKVCKFTDKFVSTKPNLPVMPKKKMLPIKMVLSKFIWLIWCKCISNRDGFFHVTCCTRTRAAKN